jgi:mRNA interferase MazF
MANKLKRGDIVWVDFGKTVGSEQGGKRPALIVQNNTGNKHSPTIIVLPLTAQMDKPDLPTHTKFYIKEKCNMSYGEQIRVIDKRRIVSNVVSRVEDMTEINKSLRISLAL